MMNVENATVIEENVCSSDLPANNQKNNIRQLNFTNIPEPDKIAYYKEYIDKNKKQMHFAYFISILLLMVLAVILYKFCVLFFPIVVAISVFVSLICYSKITKAKSKRNEYEDIVRRYNAYNIIDQFYSGNEHVNLDKHNDIYKVRYTCCEDSINCKLEGNKPNGDMIEKSLSIPFKDFVFNNKIKVAELDVITGLYRYPKTVTYINFYETKNDGEKTDD